MIEQVDYDQLYDQLLSLFQKPFLKDLPFFNDFQKTWTDILSKNVPNPTFAYIKGENKDNAQVYKQDMYLDSGFKYELNYDIFHIQSFYRSELRRGTPLFFRPCTLKQESNKILLDGINCDYNRYPPCECCKVSIDTPIFVSYLPVLPRRYIIVDGNHRLSYSINQNEKEIQARLIIPDYTSIFFQSSAEISTFLFLKDICTIAEKINHSDATKKDLVLYKNPSIISALRKEKRLR